MSDITSVKRAIEILNLYTSSVSDLGPTEVSQKLGINKATVVRLMSTLASAEVLRKSVNGRKYCLNGSIMELAYAFLSNVDLEAVALPYMQELRQKTNEGIVICIREGDERVCIATLESPEKVRIGSHVGEHSPLQAGSPGTVLLASLPDEEIDKIIERTGLPRYTELTVTSRHELMKMIKEIRKQGVWVSKGELAEFAFAVSVPIRNYTGEVIASLSINGVTMRLTNEKEKEYKELAKEYAAKISRVLGYWNRKYGSFSIS